MSTVPTQKPGRSKQDYSTPDNFIRAVKELLGIEEFYIDLAAEETNTKAARFYTEADNSLVQDWTIPEGEWAWLNPPFSKISPWVRKAHMSKAQVAVLVPAAVGSNWWRDWVHQTAKVYFLNGRLAFMPNHPTWLYPKDCALLLYGPNMTPNYFVWNWRTIRA